MKEGQTAAMRHFSFAKKNYKYDFHVGALEALAANERASGSPWPAGESAVAFLETLNDRTTIADATNFFELCENDKVVELRTFLLQKPSFNINGIHPSSGLSALHHAGPVVATFLLEEKGADPSTKNTRVRNFI